MKLSERYILETEKFKKETDSKNSWSRTRCKVFEVSEDGSKKQIGEFERNYHSLYNTWYPFEQGGKHYALCAPDYTTTSVISLPECEVVATEGDWNCYGFCPTGFYVPDKDDESVWYDKSETAENMFGKFGFVCGCVWGDDNGWKIQFLDLSEIDKGKVIRDARFGYTMLDGGSDELPEAFESIEVDEDEELRIELKGIKTYDFELKRKVGKRDVDVNELADRNADWIVGLLERYMEKVFFVSDEKPKKNLEETQKKLVRNVIYNSIMEAVGDDED